MVPISVLDLSPISAGGDAAGALARTLDLARHVEQCGYHRYWLAEHHGMAGIAAAATAVLICRVAAATSTIRVGAGGVLLSNHAPLVIAERFGTLEAFFPGRIDLGLGRTTGADPATARALRRNATRENDTFVQDILELQLLLRPATPEQAIRAVPGAGSDVPLWVLGASPFSAQLAAHLGLPFAFAAHFAPDNLLPAIAAYRAGFKPSPRLAKPRLMLAVNALAADTDEEGVYLFTSVQQSTVHLRKGRSAPLPPPLAGYAAGLSGEDRARLGQALGCSFVGSASTVRAGLDDLVTRTGADELILITQTHDPAAARRSFRLLADQNARQGLEETPV